MNLAHQCLKLFFLLFWTLFSTIYIQSLFVFVYYHQVYVLTLLLKITPSRARTYNLSLYFVHDDLRSFYYALLSQKYDYKLKPMEDHR